MCTPDIFLGFLAILFPPLAVWVKRGLCSCDSLINICLLCLGYIPGLLHAWYIIAKYPDDLIEYGQIDQENNGGRVTYVVIHSPQATPPPQHRGMSYGTTGPAASPAPQQQQRQLKGQSQPRPQQPQHGGDGQGAGAEGSSNTPPSYAEVVAGDHKVQH